MAEATLPYGTIPDDEALPPGTIPDNEGMELEPSYLSRVGQGIANIPGAIVEGVGSVISAAGTPPDPEQSLPDRLMNVLKGVGSGVTLGIYEPEASTPAERAQQALGMLMSGGKVFKEGMRIASPYLKRATVPVISSIFGSAKPLSEGDIGAAIESGTTGFGVGAAGELGASAVRGATRRMLRPGERVVDILEENALKEVQQAQRRELARAQYGQAVEEIQQQLRVNKLREQTYLAQKADAQAAAAQTVEHYEAAIARRDSAIATVKSLEGEIGGRLEETARPPVTSRVAYGPYDIAARTPETLPVIPIQSAALTIEDIGGRMVQATEGLPKAAGPSGAVEKLVTGLAGEIGASTTGGQLPIHPRVKEFFGKSLKSAKPSTVQQMSQKFYREDHLQKLASGIGLGAKDLLGLADRNLRLDQADRILQLLGDKTSTSGIASTLYWSILDDLRGSTNPLVRSYLDARSIHRQKVAANDMARFVSPRVGELGEFRISLGKVKSRFYSKKKEDILFAESFPPETRRAILDTLDTVFRAREEVVVASKAIPRKPTGIPKGVPSPRYLPVEAPTLQPPTGLPDLSPTPMAYQPGKRLGLFQRHPFVMASIITPILSAAGIPLPYTVPLAGTLVVSTYLPQAIFTLSARAARTQAGRSFLMNLFRHEPPNIHNTSALLALVNFVKAQEEGGE